MAYKIKRPVTTYYIPLSDKIEKQLDNEWKAGQTGMVSAEQNCPECGARMYFDKGDCYNEPWWDCPKGHGTFSKEKLLSKGRGWHGDTPGHRDAALKTQAGSACNIPMRTKASNKTKDIWLSIRSNEMMRDTMKALIQEIKSHNIQYTSYASGNRLYLHLKNCPESFKKELGNWIYYQPVTQMKKPPNISDYDVTDW